MDTKSDGLGRKKQNGEDHEVDEAKHKSELELKRRIEFNGEAG